MHIIYLTNEYPKKGTNGGGIGSVVHFLGRQLVSKGIRVSVVGMNNCTMNENDNDNGVQVYRLAKSTWKFAKFYDNTKRILKKINEINSVHSVDIVEGSELNFSFFPKNTKYKKLIRLHGGHHFFAIELNKKPALWRGFQERKSFRNADSFVAVSNYVGLKTRIYLQNNFDYKTIYNSININKFNESNTKKISKNTLLFVGTVCEKKGVKDLVLAMYNIKKEFPDVILKIVGRDWFFPNGNSYTKYLKEYISKDIEKNIQILGPLPHNEIPTLIESAEICVFPSHMEAMPIAWLEGLSMGKPVVGTNIGPGREAIIQGETGILAEPNSPEDLSNKIKYLLNNKSKALEMGKHAREDILSRFNSETIVNQNIAFYKFLLD